MSCCACAADDFSAQWERWDDHPARKHWEVLKDLGAGALSQVVLARNTGTGELAALKVVFLENPAVVDDKEHLELVTREADLLCMLDHPNIVECRDIIRSPRQLVLVLEWLRGGQVIDRLHELGLQYSEQQAAAIFVQLAEAVAHLHEYRILHRDIKPENVMFAESPAETKRAPLTAAQLQGSGKAKQDKGDAGQKAPLVKLVDLGMACLYDPAKPVTGPLGSPGFVAPEIIQNGVHTPAMDVFSLGVLLFIMLVGRKPFNIKESENLAYAFAHLQDAPGLKDPRWLDLSPDAKHLVMGMCAYDPARRLTMQQVLQHEWVVSRGGILPRPLGQDVLFGAATVASIRRLRNLCGGVVTFNRAAAAAGSGNKPGSAATPGGGSLRGDSAKDAYLRRLKQSQRLEASSRGGSAMNRLAQNLASSAYAKAHDGGRGINPAEDVSVRRGGLNGNSAREASGSASRGLGLFRSPRTRSQAALAGGSLHGWRTDDPSSSRRNRFSSLLPSGMPRAGTTVLLSEMDRKSRDSSIAGLHPSDSRGSVSGHQQQQQGSAGGSRRGGAGGGLPRMPSTLQLLSAAAKVYLEGSMHGSRRGGSAAAAAGALPAASNGSGSSGRQRQVADDGSIPGSQLRYQHLQAIADGSEISASSSEASSRKVEGRQRGTTGAAAAALGVVAHPSLGGGLEGLHLGPGRGGGSSESSFRRMGSHPGSLPSGPVSPRGAGAEPTAAAAAGTPAPTAAAAAAASPLSPALSAGQARLPPGASPGSSASALLSAAAATLASSAGMESGSDRAGGGGMPAGGGSGGTTAGNSTGGLGAAGAGAASTSAGGARSSGSSFDVDGMRPHVVVRRKSMENPLVPLVQGAGTPGSQGGGGRSWTEMQAHLRQQQQQQTPRSGAASREGTLGNTPSRRVVRIKPLE